jgi:hypothetical protein
MRSHDGSGMDVRPVGREDPCYWSQSAYQILGVESFEQMDAEWKGAACVVRPDGCIVEELDDMKKLVGYLQSWTVQSFTNR